MLRCNYQLSNVLSNARALFVLRSSRELYKCTVQVRTVLYCSAVRVESRVNKMASGYSRAPRMAFSREKGLSRCSQMSTVIGKTRSHARNPAPKWS